MRALLAKRRVAMTDDGFSLVEMMAALIVIALVAAAFVATFTAASVAGQWHERRTEANQLGQQRLETLVSQPWTDVGLYSTNAGFRATNAAGEPTVTLGMGPRVSSVPLPFDTAVLRGAAYTLRTDVTWRDDPSDGLAAADANGSTQDIKHITVSVSWNVGSHAATVSFDGLRGANATDVAPSIAGASLGVTVTAPATQQITAGGLLATAMTVTASTSRTASSVSLGYSNRNGRQTVPMTTSNGGTSWTVTLPTTAGPFNTGSTSFAVTATSTSGTGSGSAQVQLTQGGAAVVSVSAAPSQQLSATNALTTPITVQVTSTTAILSGTVAYATSVGTVTRPLSGSGTTWSYAVPVDGTTYAVGTETFTVSVSLADGTSATGTGSVPLLSSSLPPDVTAVTVNDPYSATSPVQSFCINSSKGTLFTTTTIDAKVMNVASTDVVQLNAPNYTGTSYYAMSYFATNADASKTFRLTVAAGTSFPSTGSITLKVHSEKTLSGVLLSDDFVTSPGIPIQSVSKATSCV